MQAIAPEGSAAGGAGPAAGGAGPAAADTTPDALTMAERARVAAASVAERAECEARYAAACAAAFAAGAPAPFRGPAADSPLGERFLDAVALVSANGFALDVRPARFLCGLTFRLGARRADGSVDRAGFLGGTADMIDCALRLQAPWLDAARRAPRQSAQAPGYFGVCERTTSLMRAAFSGDERRVRELLAAGAPLRCIDGRQRTALHWASAQGITRVVESLLEADAAGDTVDAEDSRGSTPLIEASTSGDEGAVRALLARGARQELRNRYGGTALHHAADRGHAGVVRLLCAVPGAQVDARDGSGFTPLIYATFAGRGYAVRELLACGARQELQDEHGMTALHYASLEGRASVVELLLCIAPGAAAALALRNKDGATPLKLAIRAGHAACADALRFHGAPV
jgi:ankyrin repeat protein